MSIRHGSGAARPGRPHTIRTCDPRAIYTPLIRRRRGVNESLRGPCCHRQLASPVLSAGENPYGYISRRRSRPHGEHHDTHPVGLTPTPSDKGRADFSMVPQPHGGALGSCSQSSGRIHPPHDATRSRGGHARPKGCRPEGLTVGLGGGLSRFTFFFARVWLWCN